MLQNGLLDQVLVNRRAENRIVQIDGSDAVVTEVDDINTRHRYDLLPLARRTTT
jgi:hypothetical protein